MFRTKRVKRKINCPARYIYYYYLTFVMPPFLPSDHHTFRTKPRNIQYCKRFPRHVKTKNSRARNKILALRDITKSLRFGAREFLIFFSYYVHSIVKSLNFRKNLMFFVSKLLNNNSCLNWPRQLSFVFCKLFC